jgi:hypothetical protein
VAFLTEAIPSRYILPEGTIEFTALKEILPAPTGRLLPSQRIMPVPGVKAITGTFLYRQEAFLLISGNGEIFAQAGACPLVLPATPFPGETIIDRDLRTGRITSSNADSYNVTLSQGTMVTIARRTFTLMGLSVTAIDQPPCQLKLFHHYWMTELDILRPHSTYYPLLKKRLKTPT